MVKLSVYQLRYLSVKYIHNKLIQNKKTDVRNVKIIFN